VKSIGKTSRVNNALLVIQHRNVDMTVVEAYREVGMPRSSFYYIVEKNPQAIADLQAFIEISKVNNLR
jgi:hypothetical protein